MEFNACGIIASYNVTNTVRQKKLVASKQKVPKKGTR